MAGRIHLAPRGLDPAERRQRLANALSLLRASEARSLVVVALPDEGHRHDIEVILPGLASEPRVLTTIVVEPFEGTYTSAGQLPPEGFDLQVAFDRRRARHPKVNLFPAIDPLGTMSREYPSELHRALVESVRQVLREYDEVDPGLILEVEELTGDGTVALAQALVRFFSQHIGLDEPFTSEPAENTDYEELLKAVSSLLVP